MAWQIMSLNIGTILGPYAVTAKIGEGGMGEVYRARDTTLDWDVALKVRRPSRTILIGMAAFLNGPTTRFTALPIGDVLSLGDNLWRTSWTMT